MATFVTKMMCINLKEVGRWEKEHCKNCIEKDVCKEKEEVRT